MKIHYFMVLLFSIVILLFSTCKKNTSNKPASEYFPDRVGNYWEYDVYDSSVVREHPDYSRNYTVKIKVTEIRKLVDGKDATVWQYDYPWGRLLYFVRIVGDTVKMFDEAYSNSIQNLDFPRITFLSPFQLNKRWDGKLLYVDSSRVIN